MTQDSKRIDKNEFKTTNNSKTFTMRDYITGETSKVTLSESSWKHLQEKYAY